MSIPKISILVTFRQRRCELVDTFVSTYRDEVTEALELLLQGEDDGSELLPPGTMTTLVERLLRRLRRALRAMLEAEKRHLDEVSNDALPRTRRDKATADMKQVLFDLRRMYRGSYGEEKAQAVGFERRIAKEPLPLLRQAQRVHGRLSELRQSSPDEPRYAGLGISAERMLTVLEPPLTELRAAIDEVQLELGRVQGTKVTKDRSMADFDETYRLIVRMLVSAFRLAGRHELAKRLPISLRRPAKRTTDDETPPATPVSL